MTTITSTPSGQTAAANGATSLATARFIDLVTFRRTGEPVGTPVLVVPDLEHGRLLVRTAKDAGKLKRIAHTTTVEVTPCDSRGRHLGPTTTGRARVLDASQVAPTLARLHARYRIAGPLSSLIRRLRHQDDVIIEIVLDERMAMASLPIGTRARLAGIRYAAATPTTALAALALAIVVAACGGAPSTATSTADDRATEAAPASTAVAPSTDPGTAPTMTTTTSIDGPCGLLSADQAVAILGEPVGPGIAKSSATFGNTSCRYAATGSSASIALWLHATSDRAEWDRTMVKLGMTSDMALDAIGEAAFRYDARTSQARTKISVFDGGHDFALDIAGASDPERAAATAEGLARELVLVLR